jgi:hypothetical protein
MRKTKKPPKTPSPGRVLRTNTEMAEWLFALGRRQTARARLAHCEATCAEILAQPETDPRRPHVPRMRARLAAACGALDRGHYSADWMVEIEALGRQMNTLYHEWRLARYVGGKQSKGDLWEAIADVDAADSAPLAVMRAVAHSGRLTGASLTGTRLHYQDPPGRDRSIGLAAFRVKLHAVRRASPPPKES